MDEEAAQVPEAPKGIRSTMVTPARVRTIRRVWMAIPFLGVAVIGVPNLLSLIYDDAFGLDSLARGGSPPASSRCRSSACWS
jgi:hypothetical protein